LAAFRTRLKTLPTLPWSKGVPASVGNTQVGTSLPSANAFSCRAVFRRSSTSLTAMLMSTVRPWPALGVSTCPVLEIARATRISRWPKSTSSHWRAIASPIRIPVRAIVRKRG
jgi:hypothetical protein